MDERSNGKESDRLRQKNRMQCKRTVGQKNEGERIRQTKKEGDRGSYWWRRIKTAM